MNRQFENSSFIAKLIQKVLTENQKHRHSEVTRLNQDKKKSCARVSNEFITGGESSVYGYESESQHESCQWKILE